ncbi:MAG: hypothetical protein SOX68_03050 [Faecalicoccus sp.]|uniref:hypothetical protein n=1 Tax=Faecalicoccus sp. TaxID=1971758 RepID=UPI002A81A9E1|nr:hypothetical protein [Faecalicoccus sp.]MDY4277916.1 hypothetical protein [Faecalicoccus sp.]
MKNTIRIVFSAVVFNMPIDSLPANKTILQYFRTYCTMRARCSIDLDLLAQYEEKR